MIKDIFWQTCFNLFYSNLNFTFQYLEVEKVCSLILIFFALSVPLKEESMALVETILKNSWSGDRTLDIWMTDKHLNHYTARISQCDMRSS